jgi:hypothetical protein
LEPWAGGSRRVSEQIQGLRHVAFFYEQAVQYQSIIEEFVLAGTEQAEPVFVAVPDEKLPIDW